MADRQYELVYILPPDSTEQQVAELHEQIEQVVARLHGKIEKNENWGRRRMAYEIGHNKEGVYVLDVINGSGEHRKDVQRRPRFRRRKVCKCGADKIDDINYKAVMLVGPLVSERGKILPRRISGTCAMHQRKLQVAIKRARQIALIPYVTD